MCNAMRQCAITTVVCLAGATAVQAQGLPGVPTGTVLSEVMMDVQGTEAQLYGAMLGVSPLSPQSLDGTSATDVSAASFSFSLNAGSTYLGQSITDSVLGQFNATTGNYDWTGAGILGREHLVGDRHHHSRPAQRLGADLGVELDRVRPYAAV